MYSPQYVGRVGGASDTFLELYTPFSIFRGSIMITVGPNIVSETSEIYTGSCVYRRDYLIRSPVPIKHLKN